MKTSLFRFCGVLLLAAMLAPVCVHARKNPKNPKNNMRLLYWNIQNGMWSGQGDNYDKFVEWVKAYDPDVCVWCEAQSIYKTGTADKMDVADRYLVGNWGELAARYGHQILVCGRTPRQLPAGDHVEIPDRERRTYRRLETRQRGDAWSRAGRASRRTARRSTS